MRSYINNLLALTLAILSVFSTKIVANPNALTCLNEESLLQQDAQYEVALLNDNYQFLEKNLHPNFVWVHNHASFVQDSREALLGPMRKRKQNNKPAYSTKRTQDSVQVLLANTTAVLHGYTVVERANSPTDKAGNKIGVRYHFMRTYYEENGKCLLLANHTMLIPEED